MNDLPQQTVATLGCSLATHRAVERCRCLVCEPGCFVKEISPAPCPIALKKKHSHLLQFDHHAQQRLSIQEAYKKHVRSIQVIFKPWHKGELRPMLEFTNSSCFMFKLQLGSKVRQKGFWIRLPLYQFLNHAVEVTLNKKRILYTEIFSSLVSFQDLLSDFSSINIRMRYTQESPYKSWHEID